MLDQFGVTLGSYNIKASNQSSKDISHWYGFSYNNKNIVLHQFGVTLTSYKIMHGTNQLKDISYWSFSFCVSS